MENLFTAVVNFVLDFINKLFGTTLTFMQMVVILVTIILILLIVSLVNLNRKTRQLKKLRKQIINHQIQVMTVTKGRRGKPQQVIRTTDQLRNPRKNKQVSVKKTKTLGVTNIKED